MVFGGTGIDICKSAILWRRFLILCGGTRSFDGVLRPFIGVIDLREASIVWFIVVTGIVGEAHDVDIVDDNIVFCGDNIVGCLNFDGKLLWSYRVPYTLFKVLKANGGIYATGGGASLLNFDVDGSILFEGEVNAYLRLLPYMYSPIHFYDLIYGGDEIIAVGVGRNIISRYSGYDSIILGFGLDFKTTWCKVFGSSSEDKVFSATYDGRKLYLAGCTMAGGFGGLDILVIGYDLEREYYWCKVVGGPKFDCAFSINLYDGILHVVGSTASFNGVDNFFILNLNLDGSLREFNIIGGSGHEYMAPGCKSRVINGQLILCGSTSTWTFNHRNAIILSTPIGFKGEFPWKSPTEWENVTVKTVKPMIKDIKIKCFNVRASISKTSFSTKHEFKTVYWIPRIYCSFKPTVYVTRI